jgi:CBS domain-containing protein
MQIKEIMSSNVEVTYPNCTLQEAADRMKVLDVGALPVCDGDRIVGMITDRDITVRAISEGWDPWTTAVREIMTPDAVCCYDNQQVTEAAQLMRDRQVRRVMVLDRRQRLVGMISLGDVAVGTADDMLAGETLEKVSEPA